MTTLPLDPKGWTLRIAAHLRVSGGAIYVRTVHDASGHETAITHVTETRRGNTVRQGYTTEGAPRLMTWPQLVAWWSARPESAHEEASD